jgi:hypothetical protein
MVTADASPTAKHCNGWIHCPCLDMRIGRAVSCTTTASLQVEKGALTNWGARLLVWDAALLYPDGCRRGSPCLGGYPFAERSVCVASHVRLLQRLKLTLTLLSLLVQVPR